MDTHNITLKMCPTLNPATLLPAVESRDLPHQCTETTEETYSSRCDLLDEPLDSPEVEWFTDGSCFIEMGTWKARYEKVSLEEVKEAKALPLQPLAQKAELIVLMRALQLGKEKKLNIYTDSKYGFHVL